MSKSALYAVLLAGIIAGITLTVIFAPAAAPIAVPVYASVAVGVLALLQGANAALEVKEVKETAKEAAVLVKEVAVRQEASASVALETREVAKSTHVMVNNNMLIQLELTAELSRWKANHEPSPENTAAAERAAGLLAEHRAKQSVSDANIPRAGFGEMPGKTPAERASAAPVSVEAMSPEAAQAIADAVLSDTVKAVTDAVADATAEKQS